MRADFVLNVVNNHDTVGIFLLLVTNILLRVTFNKSPTASKVLNQIVGVDSYV